MVELMEWKRKGDILFRGDPFDREAVAKIKARAQEPKPSALRRPFQILLHPQVARWEVPGEDRRSGAQPASEEGQAPLSMRGLRLSGTPRNVALPECRPQESASERHGRSRRDVDVSRLC